MKKAYIAVFFFLLPIVAGADPIYNPGPPGTIYNPTSFTLVNPLGDITFCKLVKNILQAVLQIGIPVAVLFLVYAGFLFVVARGNPTGLEKAKKNLKYVLLGIAIFLGAWVIGQVIAATINSLSQGSGNPFITSC